MYKQTAIITLCGAILAPAAQAAQSLAEAISSGDTQLNLRLRYEQVDQDDPADLRADALTLRTRLNYTTASYRGLTGFIEMDDATAVGNDDYNSTTNGKSLRAKIADPEGTEVNQAWINYKNWQTDFKWGRQRIQLDNQRFISAASFRQNEQTYDAFSVSNHSLADTSVFYARVNNVNRIFGERGVGAADGDHRSKTDLLHIQYRGLSAGTLSGYAYLIDNRDKHRFSTDTYGVRFSGNTADIGYSLEYASQQDSDNNPVHYEADYLLAEASIKAADTTFTLGYELLGTDQGNAAFITPLAALHKFQGWSDQFLVTPSEGIADLYVSASTQLSGVKLLAAYHQFTADRHNANGDDDLGYEFNLLAAKKIGHVDLTLKYARYHSGDSSFGRSDTDKLWLTLSTVFK